MLLLNYFKCHLSACGGIEQAISIPELKMVVAKKGFFDSQTRY
jgi:hypothetical protein